MQKGWNFEYLLYKKQQLSLKKDKNIKEEIEICDELLAILLFSTGVVVDDDITMEEFF